MVKNEGGNLNRREQREQRTNGLLTISSALRPSLCYLRYLLFKSPLCLILTSDA